MEAIQSNIARALALPFPHHQLPVAVAGAAEISPSTRFTFDEWHPWPEQAMLDQVLSGHHAH